MHWESYNNKIFGQIENARNILPYNSKMIERELTIENTKISSNRNLKAMFGSKESTKEWNGKKITKENDICMFSLL